MFTLTGYLHDSLLIWLKIILEDSYTYGFLSLWIVFISYYGDIFSKLKKLSFLPLALVGGLGGSLAYWSAYKLGAISILPANYSFYLLYVFIFWAGFFPFSMWLFHDEKYWDYILDKSIIFSFDKTGFQRHKSYFKEDLSQKNLGKKFSLVTGGTSGIGMEVSKELSRLGCEVSITGRDKQRGSNVEKNNLNLSFYELDMAKWSELDDFCKNSLKYDYIVLNAGGMPENLTLSDFDIEYQCASQLLGHYYLIYLLNEYGKISKNARIVWVSSGGMYLKKLDITNLFNNEKYDKVMTYANVKRGQVTLVEEISKLDEWKDFKITTMHPGWVSTNGLKDSLPVFSNVMKNRLRDLKEGADTILWLLLTKEKIESGRFYFDRKVNSPYLTSNFNPSKEKRRLLLEKIENYRLKYFS